MSLSAAITLPQSPFPPIALGFFGLGTGYLIYGPQELLGFPKRDASVDFGTGVWGIWMPGFCQFLTGTYLFLGLTLFGTFTATTPLYMAALAFSAYGVHWFALGWNRLKQVDPRVNLGMAAAFTLISVLGVIVFAKAKDYPVHGPVHRADLDLPLRHPRQLGRERAGPLPARHQADGLLPHRSRYLADVPHVRHRAGPRVQVHAVSVRPGAARLAPARR